MNEKEKILKEIEGLFRANEHFARYIIMSMIQDENIDRLRAILKEIKNLK